MTYSMDSSSVDVPYPLNLHPPQAAPQSRQSQQPQPLPPAYDIHRSEAGAAPGGGGAASASRQSYASRTTEDSLDGEEDESTEFSPVSQSPSRRRTAAPRWSDAIVVDGEDGGGGADPFRSTTPSGRRKGDDDDDDDGDGEDAKTTTTVTGTEDATSVIRRGYVDLLRLLSTPELFRDALDWQAKLDSGIDPAAADEDEVVCDGLADGTTRFEEEEEEDDSTFRGLQDSVANGDEGDEDGAGGGGGGRQQRATHSADETFAFDPFGTDDDDDDDGDDGKDVGGRNGGGGPSSPSSARGSARTAASPPPPSSSTTGRAPGKRRAAGRREDPPLPHRIFAPDAEVVLPQALTASQLFGIERETGIELEAAAGMSGLCALFGRWLAIMPEGDHDNPMDPPGMTIMRISGGGYRVTAAHRVVWR